MKISIYNDLNEIIKIINHFRNMVEYIHAQGCWARMLINMEHPVLRKTKRGDE